MDKPKYTTDVCYRVWDDREGVGINIGVDADVGELCRVFTLSKKDIEYYGEVDIAAKIKRCLTGNT